MVPVKRDGKRKKVLVHGKQTNVMPRKERGTRRCLGPWLLFTFLCFRLFFLELFLPLASSSFSRAFAYKGTRRGKTCGAAVEV